MTGKALADYIGKPALLEAKYGALRFAVTIVDARTRYGQLDFLIEPIAGSGSTWVFSDSVHITAP